jgi:inosine-uridine nucleoside N-ribohydrolase
MKHPKHRIIIDTDPGIDDALAILFALNHPDIEVLGLTTVFGNLHTPQATQNALSLLDLFGHPEIPVIPGATQPLQKKLLGVADFVHGKNGLGDIVFPPSVRQPLPMDAADWMIEQIMQAPGEISIVALAPLTNLARALQKKPDIAKQVKQVIIMGGAFRVNGNVNPVAEANIYNDPHAADQVLTASWPTTVVGLDATLSVILTESMMQTVKAQPQYGDFLYHISRFYDGFYRSSHGLDGFVGHDPTALLYLVHPECFECTRGPVRVSTEGMTAGMTMQASHLRYREETLWTDRPAVTVCLQADSSQILKYLLHYWTHSTAPEV